MSNLDKETKTFLMGALLGGALGIGIMSLLLSAKQEKKISLDSVDEALALLHEILENHDIKEPKILKQFENKFHKQENNIAEMMQLVVNGIELWKKFKKR